MFLNCDRAYRNYMYVSVKAKLIPAKTMVLLPRSTISYCLSHYEGLCMYVPCRPCCIMFFLQFRKILIFTVVSSESSCCLPCVMYSSTLLIRSSLLECVNRNSRSSGKCKIIIMFFWKRAKFINSFLRL